MFDWLCLFLSNEWLCMPPLFWGNIRWAFGNLFFLIIFPFSYFMGQNVNKHAYALMHKHCRRQAKGESIIWRNQLFHLIPWKKQRQCEPGSPRVDYGVIHTIFKKGGGEKTTLGKIVSNKSWITEKPATFYTCTSLLLHLRLIHWYTTENE